MGEQVTKLIKLSKKIWEYLLLKRIVIAAEYLPSVMNAQTGLFRMVVESLDISKHLQITRNTRGGPIRIDMECSKSFRF